MNALASRMSSRSLGDLGCIKSGPRAIHFADKIGILECRGEYQINRSSKKPFELFLELKKMAQPGTEVLIGQEFHKEIQVAGILVPGAVRCRAEQLQGLDPIAAAQVCQLSPVLFDQIDHGLLPRL